jgi:NAD(P)-dependent dehydrogenase (short-subunit alcohol dehydrogenase family)
MELAKDGILVTTVNPGLTRTGSPRHAIFKGQPRAEYAWFSISDGLPGLSMNAARAARQIVDAAVFGTAEITLSLPAKLASMSYGLAPALNIEIAALMNRLFPRPGNRLERIGRDSESWMTRSFLGFFNRRAERQYNQLTPFDGVHDGRSA